MSLGDTNVAAVMVEVPEQCNLRTMQFRQAASPHRSEIAERRLTKG
jgi:hypothetical protein